MAYNIKLSNGDALVTIADGTADVNYTSLALVGKNFAGYGQLMNENLVSLLENFSNSAPPVNPLVGQLWFDAENRQMKVYTSSGSWKTISAATASRAAPPNPAIGDQWFDTFHEQMFIWAGAPSNWKLIGPQFTLQQGITGAVPDTITDTTGISHVVIKFYVNDVVTGIWSKDAAYTPDTQTAVAGFTGDILPGLTLADLNPVAQMVNGTAHDALGLRNINGVYHPESSYVRNDTVALQTIVGPLELGSDLTTLGDSLYNIGSSTHKFNSIYATTFHGTATSALYADVAERFAADEYYSPGTVVALGGVNEITRVADELSDDVFGVISTAPAYLMNAGAGSNETHPPVAVSGRVPVQVIGRVKKGDRLVSAGNGLARTGSKSEITPWNVIGRALTSKSDSGVGTVEAIVKLSS
jgi:hypothetical protein